MTPSIQILPALCCDAAQFCDWLATATPGDRFEYHRGFLCLDRSASAHRLPERQRQQLNALADFAHTAAENQRVSLIQRRLGDDDYSYIAIKSGGKR